MWIRYRFKTKSPDYRPVIFPPPGPFWCTGYGEDYATIVAYFPPSEDLYKYWPEAEDVDMSEEEKNLFQ